MKYAMDIEMVVHEFYKAASDIAKDSKLSNQFNDLQKRGKKRFTTLERVRRENVTEMILEPIVGLDSDDYKIETEIEEAKLVETALSVEKTLHRFYSNAASKIEFLIEASYAFELLAEANERAIESLS